MGITGRDALLAAMHDDFCTDVATFSADGQQYIARLVDAFTAGYVVYRKTFLGWYPEGCAVSVSQNGAGPWEAYGSASRIPGTHDSLGGVMGAIHADVRSRLAEEDA